jgi:hypothetical protein
MTTHEVLDPDHNLGRITGRVLHILFDRYEDPISQQTGIWGDPRPEVVRYLQSEGLTLQRFIALLDERVDAKWVYLSGIGAIDQED